MRTLACSIGMVILLLFGVGLYAEENESTAPSATTVTDVDDNAYKTVTIGSQVWMAEDLRTTKYRNGDAIGTTSPATLDISSESAPKYQWAYAGDESNVATYGRLYSWYAVTDSRNVCPAGWHVPSDAEWTTLTDFLGGEVAAQGKLKEAGTIHWNSPNTGATNESGFTALPGGNRWDNGRFLDVFFANGEPETGTPSEVWLNDGKGYFRDSGLRLGSAFSWDVALGDLNGDGRLDAFVANLRLIDGSKNPPVFGGTPAEIWLNTTPRTSKPSIK